MKESPSIVAPHQSNYITQIIDLMASNQSKVALIQEDFKPNKHSIFTSSGQFKFTATIAYSSTCQPNVTNPLLIKEGLNANKLPMEYVHYANKLWQNILRQKTAVMVEKKAKNLKSAAKSHDKKFKTLWHDWQPIPMQKQRLWSREKQRTSNFLRSYVTRQFRNYLTFIAQHIALKEEKREQQSLLDQLDIKEERHY